MNHLYSVHDASVSINVPNDTARAVVDVMERDMGATSLFVGMGLLCAALKGT